MPRILRSELPDGYFHVTARSVHEAWLFRDPTDGRMFVSLLRRAVARCGLGLHAYCLMGTHYHAVVDGPTEQLSRAIHSFQSHYAREHNARHDRRGALFAERFSSWVIHNEEHLAASIEYVLMNPVRAGLVAEPSSWPWSGAPARRRGAGGSVLPTATEKPQTEHLFASSHAARLAGYGS